MAVTKYASGTQTAVISTEHTLSAPSIAGVYTVHVDLSGMQLGDELELRIKAKILTGDTPQVAYFKGFSGAQSVDDVIAISVPIANDLAEANALQFTLKQTAGTGRVYKWKVVKY